MKCDCVLFLITNHPLDHQKPHGTVNKSNDLNDLI